MPTNCLSLFKHFVALPFKGLRRPRMFYGIAKSSHSTVKHCMKSVQIRSYFWSVLSRIRTEYGEIRSISPCICFKTLKQIHRKTKTSATSFLRYLRTWLFWQLLLEYHISKISYWNHITFFKCSSNTYIIFICLIVSTAFKSF